MTTKCIGNLLSNKNKNVQLYDTKNEHLRSLHEKEPVIFYSKTVYPLKNP